jgi:hypothetical protein
MDTIFLDKVCNHIVSETKINGDILLLPFYLLFTYFFIFTIHCKEVYSLNGEEIEYVWDKYDYEMSIIVNNNNKIVKFI